MPPIRRFELAVVEPLEVVIGDDHPADAVVEAAERRVTRRVGQGGRVSLATFPYHVGRWLAGETVDVVVTSDGLVEISHRGVLVATHARQHPPEAEPGVWRRQSRARPVRPATVGQPGFARSTRTVVSALLVSAIGPSTATVGSRSKCVWSVTPWRSHRTGNCFEPTP